MEPVKNYIKEWSTRLTREKEARQKNTFAAVLFRIGNNWFALPALFVREVVELRKIHKIPHRSNDSLLGLVNIRGTLHPCVHLQKLLKLESAESRDTRRTRIYSRMVVVEKETKQWAFAVDEILSLHRFPPDQIIALPDNERTSRGILEWQGKTFDVLDENLFFRRLEQGLE
jgi:chemotaxis-related protein WspD